MRLVKERGRRIEDGVASSILADADSVHYHQDDRSAAFGKARIAFQSLQHLVYPPMELTITLGVQ
jgi:hypothetical protein